MKSRSIIAMAAVAAFAVSATLAPTSAYAQKRPKKGEEAAAVQPPQVTEAVRVAVLAGDSAVDARQFDAAATQIATARAAAVTDQDRYWVERTALKLADATQETAQGAAKEAVYKEIARASESLIANPNTPPENIPEYYFTRAAVAEKLKESPQAITYFRKARDAGSTDPVIALRLANLLFATGDTAGGITEMETAIAQNKTAGKPVPADWYLFTIGKLDGTNQQTKVWGWWRTLLQAYPTQQNWRSALANYYNDGLPQVPEVQKPFARIDLYRLMSRTGALADYNDYLSYADVATNGGVRRETVAAIEQGIAKGVLSESDAEVKKILATAKRSVASDGSLAALEKDALTDKAGGLAVLTANGYLATGDAAKAAQLFQTAIDKGGVDRSGVTLHLGIAQARAGNAAAAAAAFDSLAGTPLADIAAFWKLQMELSRPASPAA